MQKEVLQQMPAESTTHTLHQQVRVIGVRAWGLLLLHGWSSFATVLLAATLVAALSDFWVRYQDQGLRVITSASVLAIGAWAFLHWVVPVLSWRSNETRIAQLVERRFPELSDDLSTAIAFLNPPEGDSTLGSPGLRDASIRDATSAVEKLPLHQCLTIGPSIRSVVGLCAVLAVMVVLFVADTRSASFAVRRLAWPLGQEAWPRRNALLFTKRPVRLTAGEDFEVVLVDRHASLPDHVLFQYRFTDDASEMVQTKMMKPRGDGVICRLDRVTRSFEYRAVGGDDDTMEWTRLEVIEPPHVIDLKVYLEPPEYMHLAAEESGRQIRAWEGTRARIEGRLDKPLRSLTLVVEVSRQRKWIAAQLTPDGLEFTVPAPEADAWVLDGSGSYWFDWVDRVEYPLHEVLRSEIHVQEDAPPTVSIVAPAPGSRFARQARVPLQVVAKDDLGIRSVALQYNDTQVDLATERDRASLGKSEGSFFSGGESRTLTHTWDLGEIPDLVPGNVVQIQIVARDGKPQWSRPAGMQIVILSSTELAARVDQRQAVVTDQLRKALRLQCAVQTQTRLLGDTLAQSRSLSEDDLNYLQATDLNQQQVRGHLAGERGGALERIRGLLEELRSNRIDDPRIVNRLSHLEQGTAELCQSTLPRIEGALTRALKSEKAGGFHEDGGLRKETRDSLVSAAAIQGDVIQRLKALLGNLAEWDRFRQLTRELSHVQEEQRTIAQQTRDLSTAGQTANTLSLQDRAFLERLSRRQRDLARTFDHLYSRLRDGALTRTGSDPDPVEAMAMSGLMREASEHIRENRVGQASRTHDELLASLKMLMERLESGRSDRESDLLLMRAMQQEINERTAHLAGSRQPDSTLETHPDRRFDSLTRDQAHLASMAEEMFPSSLDPKNATPDPSQAELDRALKAAGVPGFDMFEERSKEAGEAHTDDTNSQQPVNGESAGRTAAEDLLGLNVARRMRKAETNLRHANASRETQDIQRRIVADLDQLIEKLAQSDRREDNGGPPENGPPENGPPENGTGSVASTSPGNDPGRSTSNGPGSESLSASDRPGAGGDEDPMAQVWGELPKHLQEQIQSPMREEFLPQYERLIVEYYRRLAELGKD